MCRVEKNMCSCNWRRRELFYYSSNVWSEHWAKPSKKGYVQHRRTYSCTHMYYFQRFKRWKLPFIWAVLKIVFIRTSTELNGKVWTPATQGSKSHPKKLEGKTCDGGLSKLPLQAPSRRPYRKKMEDLLTDLEEGKLTFSDMKEEASRIKEVKEVQRNWKWKLGGSRKEVSGMLM